MRVLVCGGRDLDDQWFVVNELDRLDVQRGPIDVVIHGCATGADTHAEIWASMHKRKVIGMRAEWDRLGKAAGPIRNARMLRQHPDLVVAFPGGRGTADMVAKARAAGVEVIEVQR